VSLDSKSVGRKHGQITFQKGAYVYRDLGSVNGSLVDGRKVKGRIVLSDGVKVRCGDSILDFLLDPGDLEPKASPDSVDAKTMARLGKENKALREEIKALNMQMSASDPGESEISAQKLKEANAALVEAQDEVRHLRGIIEDNEQRVKDAEARAATANSSLESIHSKYLDMRDQVRHTQSLLEEARSEASRNEEEAADLREQLEALTAQVEAARNRGGKVAEEVSDLKVRITERDREVERLQRELDIRDYDLKVVREENERLQEYCRTDTGLQADLERKVRNLEAVIEENRNYIAELRRMNEEKDREVREVRLGVGIADLEQEKQRLLDDFHKKSREVDDLKAELALIRADLEGAAADREAIEAKVREIEGASRARRSEMEDISDHPEYKARAREIERLTQQLDSILDGLAVLDSGMKDILVFLTHLCRSSVKIPKKVAATLGDSSLEEAVEALKDARRALSSEADSVRKVRRNGGRPRKKRA